MQIRKVNSFVLPCKVSEGRCASTSLDVGSYTWNQSENCLFKKIRSVYISQMINFNDRCFISTDPKSKLDDPNFFLDFFIDQQKICSHPLKVYPTDYDDFFFPYSGEFYMNTGQLKSPHPNQRTNIKLRIECNNEIGSRNLQYDVHLGVKLDYILHGTNLNIHASQPKLIQNQCELERTQMLTILTMALENTPSAGYLLTGNCSMFLDTDGSFAWLYHCQKVRPTLRVMEKCYDKVPIFFETRVNFFDPITRQTFPSVNEISCQHATQNLFHLDMDIDGSWYNLIPHPVVHNKPFVSSPIRLSRTCSHVPYSSNNAGLYTRKQLSHFWSDVKSGYSSKNVFKKITRKLVNQRTDSYQVENGYSSPVYLDNFLCHLNFLLTALNKPLEISLIIRKNWVYLLHYFCSSNC